MCQFGPAMMLVIAPGKTAITPAATRTTVTSTALTMELDSMSLRLPSRHQRAASGRRNRLLAVTNVVIGAIMAIEAPICPTAATETTKAIML